MSHDATNWAVKQKGLRPIAKIVLWHLADCHNPVHGCYPTQDYLASEAEVSRASVNRILAELEQKGVIRREQQVDKDTRRQLPTRYRLAFEVGFEPLDVVARVSDCDTEKSDEPCLKNDESRVSKSAVSVSHSSETLTSKRTSKGTGNALRAASEQVSFDDVWEAFPRRPMTSRSEAEAAFNTIDVESHGRVLVAAKRYHQWHIEDAQARKVDPASQLEYRVGLGKWLRSGQWVEALTLPLKSDPVPATAEGLVVLSPDHPDFIAVERMRGRKVIIGQSGKATFRIEEIEQARAA
ncbi:helix-turn-helix domain-containing protein [Devosia sp. MC521]|uniref:helix-turn-helix domain-containing protein n=1 Tax=Devosia sp. MC521 TaxID=2759954 RepID=UPI0015F87B01|nr:helix-turn-helix domain-containing protein [Devosia sp. MC521]MBJ6986920.1 helix-turn-helix domain-containing protein [Devosia sp. MC521]QMW63945.1 helix-turn-helix domain-containing protein [Devosia sp. MC521]